MKSIETANCTVNIFSVGSARPCPVIYTHTDIGRANELALLCEGMDFVLAAIDDVDWNSSLSPWPAPAAFRGGEAFFGEADAHINSLTGHIMPAVRSCLDFAPSYSAIIGYSLDGLFALYSLYKTDAFARAASISGSLWYDGFLAYILANAPREKPERIYFSLGERESATKNARLAAVYDCTVQAEKHFAALGCKTAFELNPGGHFVDVSKRIAKAINYTLG